MKRSERHELILSLVLLYSYKVFVKVRFFYSIFKQFLSLMLDLSYIDAWPALA